MAVAAAAAAIGYGGSASAAAQAGQAPPVAHPALPLLVVHNLLPTQVNDTQTANQKQANAHPALPLLVVHNLLLDGILLRRLLKLRQKQQGRRWKSAAGLVWCASMPCLHPSFRIPDDNLHAQLLQNYSQA